MRTISAQSITDTVARLCIKANTQLPQDVQAALEKAREEEPWPITKEELEKVAAADELYRRIRHWNEKY